MKVFVAENGKELKAHEENGQYKLVDEEGYAHHTAPTPEEARAHLFRGLSMGWYKAN